MKRKKGTAIKTLIPHQLQGSLFLQLHKHGFLADDMGLGKTIQAIDALRELGLVRVMVICPAVAKYNWQKELKEEGFDSTVMGDKKSKTPKDDICIGSFEFWTDYQYKLTNYPHHHTHYETTWDLIIIDEAHYLKEPTSNRTKAILGLNGLIHRAKRVWPLSGTPAPNHAGEIWVWLYTFGFTKLSYEGFIARYCSSHRSGGHYSRVEITGTNVKLAPELKAMLKRMSLRRMKSDVLDLPPLFHSTYYVKGSSDAEVFKLDPTLKVKLQEDLDRLKERLDLTDFETNSDNVLSTLEFFAQSLSSLRRYHGLKKVRATCDLIRQEIEQGQYKKLIVFGIHTDVLKLMQKSLGDLGTVMIIGETSDKHRDDAVTSFQEDDKVKIFLGNIKAAGTAITLTAASQEIFIEDDWVPGNNQQAADRAHRYGQTNTVFARHIAIKDSLDEKITSTLTRKMQELSTFL